ncbi:hypothetical protein [Pacificoceanicola onchidii]|uniref:hypothetical protein n=1 Tax=Pacificoceanicola onchidii TaxID=2562685 RepID=UPI0010A690A5|nr:hypothetical protein [Pacificoceanicola onchidii]
MPELIKLYIRQVIAGFGLSAVFVAMLLWFDVANLWHLVTHSSGGIVAVVMLWVFNGIVFAGVQFGISIMRLAEKEPPAGGKRDMVRAPAPVPVLAETKKDVLGRQG